MNTPQLTFLLISKHSKLVQNSMAKTEGKKKRANNPFIPKFTTQIRPPKRIKHDGLDKCVSPVTFKKHHTYKK